MKPMEFEDLLLNPKNGIIYFRAHLNGWLLTSEPYGKSAYAVSSNMKIKKYVL